MKNVVRNDTSVLLVIAAIFSGAAIPVLSEFLEPSQPPAVAAVEIGKPDDDGTDAREAGRSEAGRKEAKRDRGGDGDRRRPARDRQRSTRSLPAPVDDDAGGDDAD